MKRDRVRALFGEVSYIPLGNESDQQWWTLQTEADRINWPHELSGDCSTQSILPQKKKFKPTTKPNTNTTTQPQNLTQTQPNHKTQHKHNNPTTKPNTNTTNQPQNLTQTQQPNHKT